MRSALRTLTITCFGLLFLYACNNEIALEAVELNPRLMQSYQTSCKTCHESAGSGAPLAHDVKAWRPRVNKGWKQLTTNTLNGLGGMPPLGQCYECSPEDLGILIKYMASPDD